MSEKAVGNSLRQQVEEELGQLDGEATKADAAALLSSASIEASSKVVQMFMAFDHRVGGRPPERGGT